MNTASVLVLMSTYNGEKYIEAQLLSILNQKTECKVDLLIRDDGSTDGTCAIVERIAGQYSGRITLKKGSNIGYNSSFFRLIEMADGYTYYAFSDQDDVWLPDKVSVAYGHMHVKDASIPTLFASTSFLVQDDLKPYAKTRENLRSLSFYNTIIQNICPGHNQFMNRSLLQLLKAKVDVQNIYVYDSWVLNVAALYGDAVFENAALTLYRQHGGNQLGSGGSSFDKLLTSFRRVGKGEGKTYRKQIAYFLVQHSEKLRSCGYYEEVAALLESRSLLERLRFVIRTRLYRQSVVETIAFKCAFLLGLY